MRRRIEVKIVGRVQMVFFRDFVQKRARDLDLVGTVKNMENGSVGIIAEGEEENLKLFLEQLKIGPPLAKVEDMTVRSLSANGKMYDFVVAY